ncbi:unnamed protein product [Protopolystoma xenopodis]|uniref:Uncharacterized protein n=1 Tax=Protopolystoma xenopodis TaxID=117903 RepID=A0A448XQS1_9PLAT|nr:unnamed protein product [Protopolystoma xenopodis]
MHGLEDASAGLIGLVWQPIGCEDGRLKDDGFTSDGSNWCTGNGRKCSVNLVESPKLRVMLFCSWHPSFAQASRGTAFITTLSLRQT